jgi:metallophosphoesterase superfamily enzyme
LIPRNVKILPPTGLRVGNAWLLHGHTVPPPKAEKTKFLITGHVHPAIELTDRFGFKTIQPVWLRCRSPRSLTLIIMPALNSMVGHLVVNRMRHDGERLGPVFKWAGVDVHECDAYSLDGTLLGSLKDLTG